MRTRTRVLIVAVLLLLPIVARWVWFNRGVYTSPSIPEIDESQIEVAPPEYGPAAQESSQQGGRVVFDLGHNSNLEVDDLTPLQDRLATRGAILETHYGFDASLESQLRGAVALVVVAPSFLYSEWEVGAVMDFVRAGGRVLLVADPTRPVPTAEDADSLDLGDVFSPESAIPAINSLANPLGIVYFDDYLYNLVENEGNYRNVRLTAGDSDHPLAEGLESVVFFATHSLRSDGVALLTGDDDTSSPLRTGETDLAAGVLSADGSVLALGDLTALTAPYHTMADNDRLMSNVADWLLAAEREFDLQDFPYLFERAVDLVQISGEFLDPRLIAKSGMLKDILALADLTLDLRDIDDPDHDVIFVGTFEDVELVQEYLDDAGVAITIAEAEEEVSTPTPTAGEEEEVRDTIEVEGLGSVPLQGTTLFVVHRSDDRVVVISLGEDGDAAMEALDRLAAADFLGCAERDDVLICSTGEAEEGLGLDEEREKPAEETPVPEETPQAGPRVGSVLESEEAMTAGVPWLVELAEETYDETSQAGETYTYTIALERSQDTLWVYGWCTFSEELLEQNWEHIALVFTLDDEDVPLSRFATVEFDDQEEWCRLYYALVTDWPRGEHELTIEATFDTELDDGQEIFPAGTHYYQYVVTVGG